MPEPIRRAMKIHRTTSRIIGASEISRLKRKLRSWTTGEAVTVTSCFCRFSQSLSSAKAGRWVLNLVYFPPPSGFSWEFLSCPWIASPLE